MDLKAHQPPLSVEQQIDNLKSIGLIIDNPYFAASILNDISYFRIIKAFSLTLKTRNGLYHDNVTFESIVDLYKFNCNLRQLLFPIIERIEVNLRCRIANFFSCKYGVLGYKDPANFCIPQYHKEFLEDIELEINRNLRSPFVRNFLDNYIGSSIPMYALIEFQFWHSIITYYIIGKISPGAVKVAYDLCLDHVRRLR